MTNNVDNQKQQNMNDKGVCMSGLNDKAVEVREIEELSKLLFLIPCSRTRDIVERLIKAYEAAKGDGWCYDMDKAPGDGEYILVMWKGGIIPDVVQYNERFDMWLPCDCDDVTLSDDEADEEFGETIDRYEFMQGRAVCWRPLPTPKERGVGWK